jgi:hypothetical protein
MVVILSCGTCRSIRNESKKHWNKQTVRRPADFSNCNSPTIHDVGPRKTCIAECGGGNKERTEMKYYFLALGLVLFVCVGCAGVDGQQKWEKDVYHAPPAAMMQRPGPMVDGPGPGVLQMMSHSVAGGGGGAVAPGGAFVSYDTQVKFVGPAGMMVGWKSGSGYAESQVVSPGRYDFHQGCAYQLKLANLPERPGLTLYPTVEIRRTMLETSAYLSHNSVPLELTDEDLDQIQANNFVTKVIYLPNARHQELAIAGVETLVSTRLDPGVDPVAEADRRGTIMVILRVGNKDLERPSNGPDGVIRQASATMYDGAQGVFSAPTAIGPAGGTGGGGGDFRNGVPGTMMMAGSGMPGMPGRPPIAWGQPITGTPIGLPGPPHIPLGGPASLKSHTIRNLTKTELPRPVDHVLYDVKHDPGYRLPEPVRHVKYTERHPVYRPGEVSHPAYAMPSRVY